ncbi:hypothetical protein RHECNPAF_470045 [Rhizobium etli CNPAF512]|nr:hypothetical protein RHECNPAF_470045 [Rhizobium etli CNPAF512]
MQLFYSDREGETRCEWVGLRFIFCRPRSSILSGDYRYREGRSRGLPQLKSMRRCDRSFRIEGHVAVACPRDPFDVVRGELFGFELGGKPFVCADRIPDGFDVLLASLCRVCAGLRKICRPVADDRESSVVIGSYRVRQALAPVHSAIFASRLLRVDRDNSGGGSDCGKSNDHGHLHRTNS